MVDETAVAIGVSVAGVVVFACALCCLFKVALRFATLRCLFDDYTSCPSRCLFSIMPDQPMDDKTRGMSRKVTDDFLNNSIRHRFWLDHVQSRSEFAKNEEDGHSVPVRVYTHNSCSASTKFDAVLIYIHGGGWAVGSVAGYENFCRALCTLCCADRSELPAEVIQTASERTPNFAESKCRMAIVSVEYRRAPDEATFPVPLEDCYAALKWVHAQSQQRWGTSNIILCGDSAGGNLACALSRLCRDRNTPYVKGQIPVYPVTSYEASLNTDNRYKSAHFIKPKALNGMWRDYLQSEKNFRNPYANLMAAEEHKGLPPTLLIVGDGDALYQEGLDYASKLRADGVDVRTSVYRNMHHSFFCMVDVLKEAVQSMAEVKGFILKVTDPAAVAIDVSRDGLSSEQEERTPILQIE